MEITVELNLREVLFIQYAMSFVIGSTIGVIEDERLEMNLATMTAVSDKLSNALVGELRTGE